MTITKTVSNYSGVIFQKSDDYKGAVDCFQKAIHYRPSLARKFSDAHTL